MDFAVMHRARRTSGGPPALGVLLVLAAAAGCRGGETPADPGSGGAGPADVRGLMPDVADPAGETVGRLAFLDQNWSDADAARFYAAPQGSKLIPYDWFLALERADSGERLAAPAVIASLGYLPRRPGPGNPDGLPVGFSEEAAVEADGGPVPAAARWVGLTCAACHTTQLNYGGVGYVIDGAPSLGDFSGLLRALEGSLAATLDRPAKFDRFAAAVLGDLDGPANRGELRAALREMLLLRTAYNDRNLPAAGAAAHGFGRVDAFGAILNEITVRFLGIGANRRPADAPVSYPFLWDTPQHDLVQWTGVAPNSLGGALPRNTGEVLGVFGDLNVPEPRPRVPSGYRSSVEVRSLRELEEQVRALRSPRWPDAFGAPDPAEVRAGRKLYLRYCNRCHVNFDFLAPAAEPAREFDAIVAMMSDTGTDPTTAANFFGRRAKTGRLEGVRTGLFVGERFGPEADAAAVLRHASVGAIVGAWKDAPADRLAGFEYRVPPRSRDFEAPGAFEAMVRSATGFGLPAARPPANYKGRPLNGVWATAPFLHNGSVPDLESLLKPADERPKTFWLGRRAFDPGAVGFVTAEPAARAERARLFLFDTARKGNSNAGHEYGAGVPEDRFGDGLPKLRDDERTALLAFLKTL